MSCLRINSAPDLSAKLFLFEPKVCARERIIYFMFHNICVCPVSSTYSGVLLLAVPTEAPSVNNNLPTPEPPILLSANRTGQGVLLMWSHPEAPSSRLTGYVLQARRNQGQWVILSSNISANQSELLVQGLLRVKFISYYYVHFLQINPCVVRVSGFY